MRKLTDLQAGEAFGRYELLLPIARGGMSMVWAGRLCGTRGFQKLVAIKTLAAVKGEYALLERMLLDEARLASQIQHPNVAQYLDLGERDDVLYVVMEWIDGESLGAIMRHAAPFGGIPLDISAQIIEQACKGLHGAHELRDASGTPLGLVHCDVSPHNLMIADNGAVRLIDFGIAKATSTHAARNTVAGKLAFMSPEQARNEPLDRRSDLFSLGVVLYLLTTGRHPFPGKTSAHMLRAMVQNAPITAPSVIHPSYPRALERVVLRALEHDREARFESAAEMLCALTEAFPARAPEPEVAAFVQSVAGTVLAERRAAIANALRGAEAQAEARAREQRAAEARAAQVRAAEVFAAQERAARLREVQAQAAQARAAELRAPRPPAHASVPAGPEVIRMMQGASTDAPIEREAPFVNPFARAKRRALALAVSTLALAAGATVVAVRSGALARLGGAETSRESESHVATAAVARADSPEPARGADEPASAASAAVSDPPSAALRETSTGASTTAGCRTDDPACAKRRSRVPAKTAANAEERGAVHQTGEELEAAFAPSPAKTDAAPTAGAEPPRQTSEPASETPSPPATEPRETEPEKAAAPAEGKDSTQRYGI